MPPPNGLERGARPSPLPAALVAALVTLVLLCAGALLAGCGAEGSADVATGAGGLPTPPGRIDAPSPAELRPAGRRAPGPPAEGLAFGAYVGRDGVDAPEGLAAVERMFGRRLAIGHHFYNWPDDFPTERERADLARGRVPLVSWWGTRLDGILDGSQDALIRARAEAVREFGGPMLIRWAPEMNGRWFPWSGNANGKRPGRYVTAWRRVHRIFAETGADNVAWVWAPNTNSIPGDQDVTHWNNWRNYYPGDRYVDWVGISGYNWGARQRWQEPQEIFDAIYRDYAARKPVILAEVASATTAGSKEGWIDRFAAWAKRRPALRAIVWFDTVGYYGDDWRLDSSPAVRRASAKMLSDEYFAGRLQVAPPAA